MANKNRLYYTAAAVIGAGALITYCSGRDKKTEPATTGVQQVTPTPTITPPREYVVKEGDIPSVWVYNHLGLRGKSIYDKVQEIGMINGFGSERDVYMKVDNELVHGSDGYFDMWYPGERVKY
ncbi:MAG: hypothetical protein Q8P79_01645 [Nanoarchaeota archaeon]|nr:hypothetical protein [Nanoarchaeota archaeon]